jgi:S-adenosylmethionine:tRNA ribosyltransferase-isomerase
VDEEDVPISAYDYHLPESLIAQVPVPGRLSSRLMVLDKSTGGFCHRSFSDIVRLLREGDLLVMNDTRVIRARLLGTKDTGGACEALIMDYAAGMEAAVKTGTFACQCLLRSGKPPRVGRTIFFEGGHSAEILSGGDGVFTLGFSFGAGAPDVLEKIGRVPLPPYIKRNGDEALFDDAASYQTVYARERGAVAAPTAGLHFTEELFERLAEKGVRTARVTLHVGYGTFAPVRVDDVRLHRVHCERFTVSGETARAVNLAKEEGRRVIAVGTTSTRTLEFSAGADNRISPGTGLCDLCILPGHRFRVVEGLVTNFHLPKSSLLLLVSALAGRSRVLAAYDEAVRQGYRFFSYGDAMFIA